MVPNYFKPQMELFVHLFIFLSFILSGKGFRAPLQHSPRLFSSRTSINADVDSSQIPPKSPLTEAVKDFFPIPIPISYSNRQTGTELTSPSTSQQTQVSLPNADAKKNEWIARGILLCVSAFYGTNFGCVKILDQALDPSMAATLRFTLAATVFAPYMIKTISTNPQLIKGGLEVGLYSFFGYWAQSHSLLTSSASTAAFICSLAVIVVPLLDAAFGQKNKRDTPWYAALFPAVLAAAGVGCLELGGASVPGVGDLWAFAQPLCFGLSFWRVESHIKNAKQPGEPQAFTGAMMLMVAAFSWVWTSVDFVLPAMNELAFHADGSIDNSIATNIALIGAAMNTQIAQFSDWHVSLAILWTGIVTTALTSYGENMAMKSLSSAETTVIFSTEPLWGTAFAALALGETVGPNVYVGAAFIVAACLWSSLGPSLTVSGLLTSAANPVWMQEVSQSFEELMENLSKSWAEVFNTVEGLEDKL